FRGRRLRSRRGLGLRRRDLFLLLVFLGRLLGLGAFVFVELVFVDLVVFLGGALFGPLHGQELRRLGARDLHLFLGRSRRALGELRLELTHLLLEIGRAAPQQERYQRERDCQSTCDDHRVHRPLLCIGRGVDFTPKAARARVLSWSFRSKSTRASATTSSSSTIPRPYRRSMRRSRCACAIATGESAAMAC